MYGFISLKKTKTRSPAIAGK